MQLTSLSLALTRLWAPYSPGNLFSAGEQGAWYDPSDFRTMFQDAAGATPVTAVEQPVGRILDKSGRGNHATQTTSTSRPVLSARVNLLTKTEQFDDAVWTKQSATVTANSVVAPDGTTTADTLVAVAASATHLANSSAAVALGVAYTLEVSAKKNTLGFLQLSFPSVQFGASAWANFNLNTGAVGTVGGTATASIVDQGNGWYRCKVTATCTTAGSGTMTYVLVQSATAPRSEVWTPTGTESVYIWGASLVPANQASLPYQRVNTSTDYDTAGFPLYLRFDGVDDFLVTNSINFTATDKMTVFAGVRKLSDAAQMQIVELSASTSANNGSFSVGASALSGTRDTYTAASRGTTEQFVLPNGFAAPITNVLTGIGNISGDQAILRVNGAQASISTADQGTGNYGNYPLYIGRRGGTTLPANMNLYSLIVRGAQSNAGQIGNTEQWVNSKTGAY